jgi:predicted protein tyrosine phosphatase
MNKFLFVCSANKQRSKTADDYFSEKYSDLQFLSGGTNQKICQKEGTEPLTEDMLEWANCVIVMGEKHRKIINSTSKGNHDKKIKVFNIPDIYKYYQKELIQVLEEKIDTFIINYG